MISNRGHEHYCIAFDFPSIRSICDAVIMNGMRLRSSGNGPILNNVRTPSLAAPALFLTFRPGKAGLLLIFHIESPPSHHFQQIEFSYDTCDPTLLTFGHLNTLPYPSALPLPILVSTE